MDAGAVRDGLQRNLDSAAEVVKIQATLKDDALSKDTLAKKAVEDQKKVIQALRSEGAFGEGIRSGQKGNPKGSD